MKRIKKAPSFAMLAIPVIAGAGGALPTEFRLFGAGWNETEKGSFLFDADAAREVISAYEAWGVDLMIDLEHFSLQDGPVVDPDQRDARGWARLEVREGELWATSVTWTPDGARRLTEKTQRYVSPAFRFDPDTKRVLSIFNVAITSIPATHQTPALVAASRRGGPGRSRAALAAGAGMDPKLIAQAIDALTKGDPKAALDILKQMVVSAAGGDATEGGAGGDDEPNQGDPAAEGTQMDAGPPSSKQNPGGGKNAPPPPEKKNDVAAATARLMRLTNKLTISEAVLEVETWRQSHLKLESETQKLAAERATLEAAERRKLCAELVTLGAEFPATVWADDTATKLKPRWLKMDIAELRAHAKEQRAARGKSGDDDVGGVKPPKGAGDGAPETAQLSAKDLALCKEYGCEPADFAALRARQAQATTRTGG